MNYHSISVYQDIYATSMLAKYLYTATVKTSTEFLKTNFPYDVIFTKEDVSTRYVVNVELPRQIINLLITCRYIFFGEYHIIWKIGL